VPARPAGVGGRLTMARRPSRKQARRDALFVLYQHEVRGERVERLFDELREREGYAPDGFTVGCVRGVLADTGRLDATIAGFSRDWPVERLAPLERSVLRLAVFEIDAAVTPPEVAVDEAVRLTRRYSTDTAGSLVNGILGAYVRDRAGGSTAGERASSGGPAAAREGEGGGAPAGEPGDHGEELEATDER